MMTEFDNSGELEEEQFLAEYKRLKRLSEVGLDIWDTKISFSEAFELHKQIAEQRGVPQYKTETGFVDALRKFQLTFGYEDFGMPMLEWLKSGEPATEHREETSAKAIEALFRLRSEQRKKLDRQRKSARSKKAPNKIFNKVSRKSRSKKRSPTAQKRNAATIKRKPTSK